MTIVRDEFIELYNVADHSVPLYDVNFPTNTWRFRMQSILIFQPG
jgi:hypothetical protein